MFGRKNPPPPDTADTHLFAAVRAALPDADDDTVAIVSACAGLLASVAYADREFSATELARARELLATVSGIGPSGAESIAQLLESKVLELSTVHASRFTRTLRDLADHELRLHVLGMLVELCAADDELKSQEVALLRQTTSALGLEQDDYNRLQDAHKDKLKKEKLYHLD
ncbi:MAG: TerB family tellurite resistance protein [Polyangiaceae bacterium]